MQHLFQFKNVIIRKLDHNKILSWVPGVPEFKVPKNKILLDTLDHVPSDEKIVIDLKNKVTEYVSTGRELLQYPDNYYRRQLFKFVTVITATTNLDLIDHIIHVPVEYHILGLIYCVLIF